VGEAENIKGNFHQYVSVACINRVTFAFPVPV